MKKILFVLLFVLISSAAFAQTDSHSEAVTELMEVMHVQEQIEESAERMFELQAKAVPQMAQFEDIMLDFFNEYINWETMGDDIKAVYKESFTESEIQDMITFYRTDTGQKLAKVTPELTTKLATLSQDQVMAHQFELQQKMQKAMMDSSSAPEMDKNKQ